MSHPLILRRCCMGYWYQDLSDSASSLFYPRVIMSSSRLRV